MDCVIRSIDDDDHIPLYQRPRGYGGVAIAWKRSISSQVLTIPDGNKIILPIIIKSSPKDICLVNIYLPCRGGGNHEQDYDAALDSLHAILDKFKGSHMVIINGDLNASIFDDRSSRDRKLKAWCSTNCLLPDT